MRTHPMSKILVCVAALLLGAAPAAVAAPPSEASAVLRGGHFSPDTPTVDVYLTNFAGGTTTLALSNVGYGDVSDYQRIKPGLYTVGMRPAGADPSTPVAISWTLDAKPGEAFTACAVGMHDALQGRVLTDDLTPPPHGEARVRVIQAASHAPKADVVANDGPVIGSAVPFASTTDYTAVPAGSWPVTARSTDDPSLTATTDAVLDPGGITTVVLLDTPQGGLAMRTFSDGVGPADVPVGPVAAGGGATAAGANGNQWLPTFALVAAAVAFATMTVALVGGLRRTGQHR